VIFWLIDVLTLSSAVDGQISKNAQQVESSLTHQTTNITRRHWQIVLAAFCC
jgi:hypothetical protein